MGFIQTDIYRFIFISFDSLTNLKPSGKLITSKSVRMTNSHCTDLMDIRGYSDERKTKFPNKKRERKKVADNNSDVRSDKRA